MEQQQQRETTASSQWMRVFKFLCSWTLENANGWSGEEMSVHHECRLPGQMQTQASLWQFVKRAKVRRSAENKEIDWSLIKKTAVSFHTLSKWKIPCNLAFSPKIKNGRGNLQGIEQTSGDLLLFSSSQHLRAHSDRPQT